MSREEAARIDEEERALALAGFDNDDAWWLGGRLREMGIARGAALAIEVRRGGAAVFRCLLPGATANNVAWMRRKLSLSLLFERSSHAVGLDHEGNPGWFERAGLDWRQHSPAGGAVPIRVAGTGVVGAVCVGGLSSQEDHDMAVEALLALRAHKGARTRTAGDAE